MLPDPYRLRTEVRPDAPAVRAVVTAAFGRTDEADLVDALRRSDAHLPLLAMVAESEGHVIGHVMISRASLRTKRGHRPIGVLAPLAVLPAHHGHGVGGALVQAVVDRAEDAAETLVFLEGSPEYYGRLGFAPSAPLGITVRLPAWAPAEAAQVRCLSRYNTELAGEVVYPLAFDDLTP